MAIQQVNNPSLAPTGANSLPMAQPMPAAIHPLNRLADLSHKEAPIKRTVKQIMADYSTVAQIWFVQDIIKIKKDWFEKTIERELQSYHRESRLGQLEQWKTSFKVAFRLYLEEELKKANSIQNIYERIGYLKSVYNQCLKAKAKWCVGEQLCLEAFKLVCEKIFYNKTRLTPTEKMKSFFEGQVKIFEDEARKYTGDNLPDYLKVIADELIKLER